MSYLCLFLYLYLFSSGDVSHMTSHDEQSCSPVVNFKHDIGRIGPDSVKRFGVNFTHPCPISVMFRLQAQVGPVGLGLV